MSAMNETLIRYVVAEVLGKLNGLPRNGASTVAAPAPAAPVRQTTPAPASNSASSSSCGCEHKKSSRANVALRGKYGVFQDANEACEAAQEAYLQLKEKGIAARRKMEEIVKRMADRNAGPGG